MNTLTELFACWASIAEMADDLGENQWRVQKWKQRGRIPVEVWQAVIDAVQRKGKDLTAEQLLAMHTDADLARAG